jgi:hypothetical protein
MSIPTIGFGQRPAALGAVLVKAALSLIDVPALRTI